MNLVLAALKEHGRMAPDKIADATKLDLGVVEATLHLLLLRRLVACSSHKKPGRGGQSARFIGEAWAPLWSLEEDDRPE